jgi:hypothetical protein
MINPGSANVQTILARQARRNCEHVVAALHFGSGVNQHMPIPHAALMEEQNRPRLSDDDA